MIMKEVKTVKAVKPRKAKTTKTKTTYKARGPKGAYSVETEDAHLAKVAAEIHQRMDNLNEEIITSRYQLAFGITIALFTLTLTLA